MTEGASVAPVDGSGEHIWFLGAGLVTIKVPGEEVDDRCTVIEFLMPKGLSPPKHTHPQDEAFVMLDGEVTFVADQTRFVARAGDSWLVPRDIPHTFRVDSETCRMVAVYTPAGPEHCFRNGGVPAALPTLPPQMRPPGRSKRSRRRWRRSAITTSGRLSVLTTRLEPLRAERSR